MVIGLIGVSCTGKSTVADIIANRLGAEVVTGKEYLSLAKNEQTAKTLFRQKLETAAMGENHMVYVASELEQVNLLPTGAVRVVLTADIDCIKERFAKRLNGNMPSSVAAMLERKHNAFNSIPCALRIDTTNMLPKSVANQILAHA